MGKDIVGIKTLVIDDFGGVVTEKRPELNESYMAINCFNEGNRLRPWFGFKPGLNGHTTPTGTHYTMPIGVFYSSTGVPYVVLTGNLTGTTDIFYANPAAGGLYPSTATSPYPSIKGDATISSLQCSMCMFQGNAAINDATNGLFKWIGPGNNIAAAGGSPPTKGDGVNVFKDRLFMWAPTIGITKYPSKIAYSNVNSIDGWDTTVQLFDLEADTRETILYGAQLGNAFIVYKDRSIGRISGSGESTWLVEPIITSGNMLSKTSFAEAVIEGISVHIFLSQDGLVAFDGTSLINLPRGDKGSKVAKFWKAFLQNSSLMNSVSSSSIGFPYATYIAEYNLYVFTWAPTWPVSFRGYSVGGIVYNVKTDELYFLSPMDVGNGKVQYLETSTNTRKYVWGSLYYTPAEIDFTTTAEQPNLTTYSNSSVYDDDIFTNGSMEADANWTDYNIGAGDSNSRSNTQAHQGTYSRKIVSDNTANIGCYQDVTVVANSIYRIYGFAYCSVDPDAVVQIQIRTTADVLIDTFTCSGTLNSWVMFSDTVTVPTGVTTLRVCLVNVSAATTYWDDVHGHPVSFGWAYETDNIPVEGLHIKKRLREVALEADATTGSDTITITAVPDCDVANQQTGTVSLTATATESIILSACTTIGGLDFRRLKLKLSGTDPLCIFGIDALSFSYFVIGDKWL